MENINILSNLKTVIYGPLNSVNESISINDVQNEKLTICMLPSYVSNKRGIIFI